MLLCNNPEKMAKNVWPDFICRTDKDPNQWGHHQHIAQ